MIHLSAADAKRLGLTKSKAKAISVKKSSLGMFERVCLVHGLPEPVAEYQFCPERGYRSDYAFFTGTLKVLLEIDGAVYGTGKPCKVCGRSNPGGHSSIAGIKRDIEKQNLAVELGFIPVRCLPEDVSSGAIFLTLKRILSGASESKAKIWQSG